MDPDFVEAVLDVVRHIPTGKVLTYGDVASDAGLPGRARLVGRILSEGIDDIPWWRVVPVSRVPIREALPRLKREGSLTDDGRVDLKRVRWSP